MLLHTANFHGESRLKPLFPRNEIKPEKASYEKPACFTSSLVKIVLNLDKQMWKNFNLQRIARKTAFNLFLFFFFLVENSIKS